MESGLFSKYVRLYNFVDKCILYNTKNGVCVIVPDQSVNYNKCYNYHDKENLFFLKRHEFFIDNIDKEKENNKYLAQNILHVSLETSLMCNFACPYCYQKNNHYDKGFISSKDLKLLLSYIQKVNNKTKLDVLNFKILGGEPSISWSKITSFLSVLFDYCKTNRIKLNLKVDTNGFYIEPFLNLDLYDTILFTIPLCHKSIHDKYRQLNGGGNTYDRIVNNLNELSQLRDSNFVIRHNTDASNIQLFDSYLYDLRNKLDFCPNINPQYTTNPTYGSYKNQLSRADFIKWLSTSCIDSLIKHNFSVYISPLKIGACSYNSPYSIKLFSSGKVGACARFFYDANNPLISEIITNDDFTNNSSWWKNAKKFSPFDLYNCLNCSCLFSCGGHYYLPCIKDYDLPMCDPEKTLYLDYKEYFTRLYKYYTLGKIGQFKNIKFVDLC